MMTTRRAATALLALLPLLSLAACGDEDARFSDRQRAAYIYGNRNGNFGGGSNEAQRKAADSVSYWDGDGVAGAPTVEIHLHEQRAYFYKGDVLVGLSQISSGREGHNTPPGSFKIIQKDPDHRSSEYGDYVDPATQQVVQANVANGKDPKPPGTVFLGAPMPNFMRLTNGGVGMHAGYLPGVPASHGCIRMPAFMAQNFFNNAPMGTPVTVTN